MREEAGQRVLRGRRVERGVVYAVIRVRPRRVDVVEEADGEAGPPPVAPVERRAPLVRLVEAAAVLRDGGAEDAERQGFSRLEPLEQGRPRVHGTEQQHAAVARERVEEGVHAMQCAREGA